MVNIQGKYTLSELALRVGMSTSWINKIQKRTGIGGDTGKQGRKVHFNDDDVYIFNSVKLLRMLNYSLSEIKKIYEVEKRMLSCRSINSQYKAEVVEQGYHYIIHPHNFTYDEHAQPGEEMAEYGREIYDYKKWADFIYSASVVISERSKRLEEEFKAFALSISKNVEAGHILLAKNE